MPAFGSDRLRRLRRRTDAVDGAVAGAPGGRRRRLVAMLSVAVLIFAGLAGGAWYDRYRAQQRDGAVRDSVAAANTAAQAIFSYDYRRFDANIANAKSFVTGKFAKEYGQTTSALKAAAEKEQAIVRAQVSATGVITADQDKVELLLYVNQYRRNVNIAGEKVDQNRVTLTMIRVGREWRVSAASAV